MAPIHQRQLLGWSLPAIVIIFGYFWFKRKRLGSQSDSGDSSRKTSVVQRVNCKNLKEELDDVDGLSTPRRLFSRSLSGVDSAPIDIVVPRALRSTKSNPNQAVISDEDLDLEIEKIKSMSSGYNKSYLENQPKQIDNRRDNGSRAQSIETYSSPLKAKSASSADNSSSLKVTMPVRDAPTDSITVAEAAVDAINGQPSNEDSCTLKSASVSSKTVTTENNNCDDVKSAEPARNENEKETVVPSSKGKSVKNRSRPRNKANQANGKSTESMKNIANSNNEASRRNGMKCEVVEKQESEKETNNSTETPKMNGVRRRRAVERHSSESDADIASRNRRSSERDSANHSPADVMRASPTLSNISSDVHSEASSDSGKGCSDPTGSPPPELPVATKKCFEFFVPIKIVGRLIGRQGCFVTHIKQTAEVGIIIRPHPLNEDGKICVIEGSEAQIEQALQIIRNKFPLKNFPQLTLRQISVQLSPDRVNLQLEEGVHNAAVVSHLSAVNHFFLNMPQHITYYKFNDFTREFNSWYFTMATPALPTPIPKNAVCAAFIQTRWIRAIVVEPNEGMSLVRCADSGASVFVYNTDLRQIKPDFTTTPFQAIQCFLANIEPPDGVNGTFCDEAFLYVSQHAAYMWYTQVVDYTPGDNLPVVHVFIPIEDGKVIHLNKALVELGYAKWIDAEVAMDNVKIFTLQNVTIQEVEEDSSANTSQEVNEDSKCDQPAGETQPAQVASNTKQTVNGTEDSDVPAVVSVDTNPVDTRQEIASDTTSDQVV